MDGSIIAGHIGREAKKSISGYNDGRFHHRYINVCVFEQDYLRLAQVDPNRPR